MMSAERRTIAIVVLVLAMQYCIFLVDEFLVAINLPVVILHAVPLLIAARNAPTVAAVPLVINAVVMNGLDDFREGEDIWTAWTAALTLGLLGVLAMLWAAQQRTERAQAEENERLRLELWAQHQGLLETQRARDMVVAMLSHDVMQPLSLIQVMVRVLQRTDWEREQHQVRALLLRMEASADRLGGLVQDLMDIAQAGDGTLRVQGSPARVDAMAKHAVSSMELSHPAEYLVVVPPDLPLVLADTRRLEQVLTNLLTNAAVYARDCGPIRVTASHAHSTVVVSVEDRGPGVPEADRQRVFEPFVRLASGAPGHGLGLALARAIVEAHGGRIWVESGTGGGAAFRFSLPTVESDVSERPSSMAVAGEEAH